MTVPKTASIKSAFLILLLVAIPVRVGAGWVESGNILCDTDGHQWYPRPVPDGNGGCIVLWQDHRTSAGNVYMQSIGVDGICRWTSSGAPMSGSPAGREFFRQAVPDGAGGAVVVWTDHRNGGTDVYAQRTGADGALGWGAGGILVSGGGENAYFPVVVSAGDGGVIVAWQGGQAAASRVMVQKITPSGTVAWQAGGIEISTTQGQSNPCAVSDGAGGCVIAWNGGPSESGDLLARRIDTEGDFSWGVDPEVLCPAGEVEGIPSVCSDGGGGMIVAWQDRGTGTCDIYAQRISGAGTVMWAPAGVPISTEPDDQWLPQVAGDGSGGCWIVWMDGRGGGHDIYGQRVGQAGNALWTAGGRVICDAQNEQLNPQPAYDGQGNLIVVWQDRRGGDYDIYAQKLDIGGNSIWTAGGSAVKTAAGDQRLPELVADGTGGAVIVWEDWGEESDIICQRISASGEWVATALAGFTAGASTGGIELAWTMSAVEPDMEFIVMREDPGEGGYSEIDARITNPRPMEYAAADMTVEPGREYVYRVDVTGSEGRIFLFETGSLSMPAAETSLSQNYPNPFNPVTTIEYDLAERSGVRLAVYDVAGRTVNVIVDSLEERGRHSVTWNGLDHDGSPVSSGVYFYRLICGKEIRTRKMILLR